MEDANAILDILSEISLDELRYYMMLCQDFDMVPQYLGDLMNEANSIGGIIYVAKKTGYKELEEKVIAETKALNQKYVQGKRAMDAEISKYMKDKKTQRELVQRYTYITDYPDLLTSLK